MRILFLLVFAVMVSSCSGGSDSGISAEVQRLMLSSYSTGGSDIDLTLAGSTTGSFPAVTYYIFGTATDMGSQPLIPMSNARLNEQAFGPFAHGDEPQQIDLSPWENYAAIYLRAVLVTPNKTWKLVPGTINEFSTN